MMIKKVPLVSIIYLKEEVWDVFFKDFIVYEPIIISFSFFITPIFMNVYQLYLTKKK